jgi:tetratricopeptide (TPR) repeat protein
MSENNSSFFQTNRELFVVAGLIAVCALIYWQAVGFQFINFDDNFYVYDNAQVMSGLNWNSFRWALTAFYSANWHPLTWISHSIDVSLFGKNAGAHHATNIIFHIINSILAFVVFRKMTGSFWKSAIIAALFAVHPAHVESVAWISERKDVLSTMFWLLTMLAYFNYAEFKRENGGGRAYYILTIVLFALGLMSKPMLVTLPFVLLLCDYWSLERLKTLKDLKPLIVEKIPLFALAAISSYITILAQKASGAVQTIEQLPIETRLSNASVACAKYIYTLFYPVDLSVAYPYKYEFASREIIGSVALLAAITGLCVWQSRRGRKYLLMGWLWFLGTLVPVIGIIQVGAQSMADRYTYVPYFGLFIMLVWGADEIFSKFKLNRIIAAAFASIVIIALGALCFRQISFWRNNETLYTHAIDVKQASFLVSYNFCDALLTENRLSEAEKQCLAAIDAAPNFVESYNALGVINFKTGNHEGAVERFKQSIRINPGDPVVYTNLVAPLALLGKTDEAAQNVEKAADLYKRAGANPAALGNSYSILAMEYAKTGRYDKSSEYLANILQLSPERADIRANYALALYFQDKLDEARVEIDKSISQNPNLPDSYNTLGIILMKQNKSAEAVKQFEKALQLKPDYKPAKENLEKAKGEK